MFVILKNKYYLKKHCAKLNWNCSVVLLIWNTFLKKILHYNVPLQQGHRVSIEQIQSPFTQECFLPSKIYIGSVFFKKISLNKFYFYLIVFIKRGWFFIWTKLRSCPPQNASCKVCKVEIGLAVLEKKWTVDKICSLKWAKTVHKMQCIFQTELSIPKCSSLDTVHLQFDRIYCMHVY